MKNSTVDYILLIVIVAVLGIGGYFALSAMGSDIKNFFKNLTAPFSQLVSTAGGFFSAVSQGVSSAVSTLTTGTTTTNLQTGLTIGQNNTSGGITGTTGAGGNEQNIPPNYYNIHMPRGIGGVTSPPSISGGTGTSGVTQNAFGKKSIFNR